MTTETLDAKVARLMAAFDELSYAERALRNAGPLSYTDAYEKIKAPIRKKRIDLEASLRTELSSAVPTVYAIVPIEPTPEIIAAGRACLGEYVEDTDSDYKRIYYAMLSAAPQPPSAAMQPLTDSVHSCSFFCNLPDCIKTQRDEFRDEMASAAMPASSADLLHLWETIYDHGAGKHKGAVSMAQRQKAFEIVKRMGQAAPQPPTLGGGA